ncbi:MAG: anthranilate phosphoribosyltransferase [Puniceicoccaceae bacterium]|nr:MAG: anthranilate phosphoribosyltransferase [Puniceicoccaceae bacterium]
MSTLLPSLTATLRARHDLDADSIRSACTALVGCGEPPESKEGFLEALAQKGETGAEIAVFAETFRGLARDPGVAEWAGEAVDVCGTGGDRAGSFNISTTVALALASVGVKVFKHGNRSITSRCGSADLFAALGVPLEADPGLHRRMLEELGYAFFFAPAYHPAFKEIVPVRKALAARGQRTVFNLLGPLINPGAPAHQLVGVFAADFMPVVAEALGRLPLKAGLVVHGRLPGGGGLDELSTATENLLAGAGRLAGWNATWAAGQFGLAAADAAELAGGDVEENLHLLDELAAGRGRPALLDAVCLNAGLALWMCGRVGQPEDGVESIRTAIAEGRVRATLEATRAFFRG